MTTTATVKPLPPTPDKKHLLFGSAFYFAQDSIGFMQEHCPKYNGIFRVTSRFEKLIIVYHPEYIRHVLQDNNRNYVKSFGYEVLKMLLGNGLLTSEGEFWKKQRRLIQPSFSRERLAALHTIMTDCVNEAIEDLERKAGKGVVNLQKDMMALALNIVARSLFSSDVKELISQVGDNLDVANESAIDRIRDPFRLPPWVPTLKNIREKRAIQALDKVIMKIIDERRRANVDRQDLMGMLMAVQDEETGERMSDRQLRDEAMTLFLAGHETTALALSWLWYCMHKNPDVEKKVLAEAKKVLNGRTPEHADFARLDYTRQVIEESLRLYPPAWMVGRKALEDDEIGGFHIPKGYNLLMPTIIVHRDPHYWDEPEKFKPERFEKDKSKDRDRFAYFPFGGGQRLCVGNNFAMMEMLLSVSMMIQKFHFRLADGFEPGLDPLITLRPKGGMMMEIEKFRV